MLFSVEQAFVGREEIRSPLKTPAGGGYVKPASTVLAHCDMKTEGEQIKKTYLHK